MLYFVFIKCTHYHCPLQIRTQLIHHKMNDVAISEFYFHAEFLQYTPLAHI